MKTSTANTDSRQMCDVAMAGSYVRDIGGPGPSKVIVPRVLGVLSKMFPHNDNPKDQWTERRVRGFLFGDAAHVRYREMVELHSAAEKAKAERELLAAARKEHAAFIEKTARLRALLEHQDENFHRPQIEGLGGVVGRVDRPGIER